MLPDTDCDAGPAGCLAEFVGYVKVQIQRGDLDSQALDNPQFAGISAEEHAPVDVIFFVTAPEPQIWNLYKLYQNDYSDASLHNYLQVAEKKPGSA